MKSSSRLLSFAAQRLWPVQQANCWHELLNDLNANGSVRCLTSAAFHHQPPRRAMLYVPGAAERKLRKAASELSVDSIIMDCEDGVAANMKEQARKTIAAMLDDENFPATGEVAVRINPVNSGLAQDDLAALLSAKRLPNAIVVPKVESSHDIDCIMEWTQRILAQHPQRHQHGGNGSSSTGAGDGGQGDASRQQDIKLQQPMALVPMCESALALLNLRQTFEAALNYGAAAPLQLQACILGGDDMAASLGATRTPDNSELAHVRGTFLTVCRAFQVQAIDIVKIDLSEAGMKQLADESKHAAMAGWSGKQVIHPKQVPIVQSAFSPSATDIHNALRLIAAYQEHQQQGQGAFVFEGKMIDAPTVLQARNVLALAERLDKVV